MTKIVLINGPKRSGKSTLARTLKQMVPSAEIIGFSYHLKRFVHGIYLGQKGFEADPDCFDAVKEEPQEILGGRSWRWAYIHYSEIVIKPLHGKEWFGQQFIRSVEESDADIVFVPDSGFVEEAETVVRRFGSDKVTLIRLRRRIKNGDGFIDFGTDSRNYITLSSVGVHYIPIINEEGQMDVTSGRVLNAIPGERSATKNRESRS